MVVVAAAAVGRSVAIHNTIICLLYVTHLSRHQDSTIQNKLNGKRLNDDEDKFNSTSADEKEEEDACKQANE